MEELIAEEKQKELERLEKGDVKAMILAAMITIFPICLGLILLICLIAYFFMARLCAIFPDNFVPPEREGLRSGGNILWKDSCCLETPEKRLPAFCGDIQQLLGSDSPAL